MEDVNKRIERIEKRLATVEQLLRGYLANAPAPRDAGVLPAAPAAPDAWNAVTPAAAQVSLASSAATASEVAEAWPAAPERAAGQPHTPMRDGFAAPRSTRAAPVRQAAGAEGMSSTTRLMGWCAGITFLLATTYFLKLVYDAGWLTPLRQMGLAYCTAIALIGAGWHLAKREHQYASYLPALGLVILYLTTFTGHLYYDLFARSSAILLVGVTTLLGIGLGRKFENSLYVVFAAVGVYVTPLLMHSDHGNLVDLVVYYSAWSLLFSFCSIQEQKRITYLLPMYLAMLGFDLAWRLSASSDEWILAVFYQLIQFAIFSITTALFSIVHREAINDENALAHGLALLIFYGIEYGLLREHAPDVVNLVALLSAVFVCALFCITSKLYEGRASLEQGATLVSAYCSGVAVHAGFFGVLSERWLPWAAMLAPGLFFLLPRSIRESKKIRFPILLASVGLYVFGYGSLALDVLVRQRTDTPMPTLALSLYGLMLYGIYYQFTRKPKFGSEVALALYAGHLALMACSIEIIERDIYLSALWACYAVVLLILAMRGKDKILGQSALLLFCAAGIKVLLFDLSGSNSMLRVLVLLVLSISLYLGGWLYQSLSRSIQESA